MEPRLSVVTLGVSNLERARAFYESGLGWRVSSGSSEQVAFIQLGGVVLALYPEPLLAED
ncbi:MAG: VOC family protein, partial [Planctomycetaceae bacterium]